MVERLDAGELRALLRRMAARDTAAIARGDGMADTCELVRIVRELHGFSTDALARLLVELELGTRELLILRRTSALVALERMGRLTMHCSRCSSDEHLGAECDRPGVPRPVELELVEA